MTLTAQGKVKLHTKTYALEDFNQAMDDLHHGHLHGRGILLPAHAR
jgi:NAD+-dependent secondary alcohol dehydrogenase Adh1